MQLINEITGGCSNVEKQYTLIISNPPIRAGKKVVHDILLNSIKYLEQNGRMYCVIQKKQGAESALKALEEVYKKVEVVAEKVTFLSSKKTDE